MSNSEQKMKGNAMTYEEMNTKQTKGVIVPLCKIIMCVMNKEGMKERVWQDGKCREKFRNDHFTSQSGFL